MKKLVDLKLYSFLSESNLNNLNWTSLEDALDILSKNHVSIFSFTDFNLFKSSFYHNVVTRSNELGYRFKILPGVEIDFSEPENEFKALIIFSDHYNAQELENIQNLISYFFNKKSHKISIFMELFRKHEYEMIIDLNFCEKLNVKDMKKISRRINYVICEKNNNWYQELLNNFKKEIKNLVFYESNNWKTYHPPKTYIEIDENQILDFKYIFANLECED